MERKHIEVIIMIISVLMLAAVGLHVIKAQLDATPAWDGVYSCNPGSTYTTKECK